MYILKTKGMPLEVVTVTEFFSVGENPAAAVEKPWILC